MVHVKEKMLVKMVLSGSSVGHARTDVAVRDVSVSIDEPVERGGTNLGPTPTETLAASLLGCTNVIARRIAKQMGIEIHGLDMELEVSFDRRGVSLVEAVDVPFPAMRLSVALTTDASSEEVERLKSDLRMFCPISRLLRAAGTSLEETWKVQAA